MGMIYPILARKKKKNVKYDLTDFFPNQQSYKTKVPSSSTSEYWMKVKNYIALFSISDFGSLANIHDHNKHSQVNFLKFIKYIVYW